MSALRLELAVLCAATAYGCVPDAPTTLSGPSGAGSHGNTAGAGGASSATTATGASVTSGAGGAHAMFSVSLNDAAPSVDLASTVDLTVTVTPNGYVGPVDLSANGLLSAGVAASFAMPALMLDGSANATTKLTLKTGSATAPKALPFTVIGNGSSITANAAGTLTVRSAITLTIPANANQLGGTTANPYKTAFGPYPIYITAPPGLSSSNPVTVRFYNADSVSHEIHASQPNEGFAHDPGPIPAQSMDAFVRKINTADTFDFYLHDQVSVITIGRIIVQ